MVVSAIWKIFSFSEFFILCYAPKACEIIAKYEKRGKYLSVLKETTCNNYFVVKCVLKSNMARVFLLTYLLHRGYVIQCKSNIARSNRSQLNLSFYFSKHLTALYFHTLIRIFYTLFRCFVFNIFCNRFVFECFVSSL